MQKKIKSGAAVLNNLDDGWQNRKEIWAYHCQWLPGIKIKILQI